MAIKKNISRKTGITGGSPTYDRKSIINSGNGPLSNSSVAKKISSGSLKAKTSGGNITVSKPSSGGKMKKVATPRKPSSGTTSTKKSAMMRVKKPITSGTTATPSRTTKTIKRKENY